MAKTAVSKQESRTRNGVAEKSTAARAKPTSGKKSTSTNKKDAQHVVEQDGSWIVKSALSGRFVSQPYPDKREAIDAGRRLARSRGSDLLVHGRNGQIFQHSPAASALPEDVIRTAIRSANEKVIKKSAGSRNLKKSAAKKK
jgi:hypothetical protein